MSRTEAILRLLLALFILPCNTSISSAASTADAFLHCLAAAIPPNLLHTPPSPSYSPLRLVRVPESVTVFTIRRSRKQLATHLIAKWQEIAPALPPDLYLRVVVHNQDAQFQSLFLGRCDRLVSLMRAHFSDLGMVRADCEEITWIQSTMYFAFHSSFKPLELLLDRGNKPDSYVKAKSDYVQVPIPWHVWESTWTWLAKQEAGILILDPYGGRMGSVAPSATPFPHRKGNLYNLQYYSSWSENGTDAFDKHMAWVRGLYKQMEPYVSKNPRTGYVNYRDLDLGRNELGDNVTSYAKARVWGEKYFKGNFERLAAVKAMVDPDDFFRNEQSIPPLPAAKGWNSM
ncbi:unnamed protein product [Triticum turgidum subsp. durum]|uniref:Berberine/berberine-like domain-containing protein n=1 Tax=Triticum turgidum subsp. durum TaxID=4567 RepID=A0A9R1A599_TRITD|nr:unnamed protein product [Triticum turgidum subsp. durum]